MPSIHSDPTAQIDAEAAARETLQSLRLLFSQVGPQIIELIANAILSAFGLSKFDGTLDEILSNLETAFKNIPGANVIGAIAGVIDQALRDAIANALGHSGTGHLASDIETYLAAIPNANITAVLGGADLGADVQAFVDHIANALGFSGTGHTLANLVTYFGEIPNANITAVLGGANLGADVQAVVDKISNALGFSGIGHTLADLFTYVSGISSSGFAMFLEGIFGSSFPKTFPFVFGSSTSGTVADFVSISEWQQLVDGLVHDGVAGHTVGDAVSAVRRRLELARSDVSQAILDGVNSTNENTGIAQALQNIPLLNILSILGGGRNLGEDLQGWFDTATGNFIGTLDADAEIFGKALSDLFDPSGALASALTGAWADIVTALGTPLASDLTSLLTSWANVLTALGAMTAADINALLTSWATLLGGSALGSPLAADIKNLLTSWATVLGSGALGSPLTADITNLLTSWAHVLSALGAMTAANIKSLLTSWTTLLTSGALGSPLAVDIKNMLTSWATVLGASALGSPLAGDIKNLLTSWASVLGTSALGSPLAADIKNILTSWATVLGSGALGAPLIADVENLLTSWAHVIAALGNIAVNTINSVFGNSNLGQDIQNALGSSWPKTFPFTFGTSTSAVAATYDAKLQQLVDGFVNNGTFGNDVTAAVGAYRKHVEHAKSEVSQAILDGVNGANSNTGVSQALSAYPTTSIAPTFGNGSLGEDLQQLGTTLFDSATQIADTIQYPAIPAITVGGVVTDIRSHIQSLVDNVVIPILGGGGGNSPAAMATALTQIPHTNVLVPPNPGSGITWDANANGTPVTGTGASASLSWSHILDPAANCLIVRTSLTTTATQSPAVSVSCGSVPMAFLAQDNLGVGGQIWGLLSPPTGSQTISIQLTTSSSGNYIIQGESDSYFGVASIGSSATTDGRLNNPSHTVSSATGDVVVQIFTVINDTTAETLSSNNQTSRYNSGSTFNVNSGVFLSMLAQDANGAASVTFSVTASSHTSDNWDSVAVNLIPISSTPLGSGFRVMRSSVSTVSLTANPGVLPGSYFDTPDPNTTADYGYNSATTNTLTIGYAGWYSVTIKLLASSSLGTSNVLVPVLYQNGNPVEWGSGASAAARDASSTFILYCNADDTLQPGYAVASSISGVGDGATPPTRSYFAVSLMNRSAA